jgi:predicted ribosomally synthesized peptide with nif11-like leader
MSKVKEFYSALAKDEAMKNRLEALSAKYKDAQPDENTIAADIAAFAKAEGYDFTPEQFAEYAKQSRELSDKELEVVAGGARFCVCAFFGSGAGVKDGVLLKCMCIATGYGARQEENGLITCVCPVAGGGG